MKYEITNTIRIFNSSEYAEERRKLLDQLRIELKARTSPVVCLIDSIVYHVSQPITVINPRGDGLETIHATPTLLIEQALRYGLVLGILLERYRETRRGYDVTGVTAEFIADTSEERRWLMDEMRMHIQAGDPEMQWILVHVAQEAEEASRTEGNRSVEKTAEIAMRQGMAIGILAEQDRQLRAGRIV